HDRRQHQRGRGIRLHMTEQPEQTEQTDAPAGSEVTRFIPVPTSISEQAQTFLGMADLFGGDGQGEPHHTDIEGWRAMIKHADEVLTGMLGMEPPDPPSVIEETSVDGVPVFVLTPEGTPEGADQPIYFDIHGGAMVMGGGEACRVMAAKMAATVRMKTWS